MIIVAMNGVEILAVENKETVVELEKIIANLATALHGTIPKITTSEIK